MKWTLNHFKTRREGRVPMNWRQSGRTIYINIGGTEFRGDGTGIHAENTMRDRVDKD